MDDDELVGLKEIAEQLGVKHQTARQWSYLDRLPEPDGTVSGSPAWRWGTIRAWAIDTGRLPTDED